MKSPSFAPRLTTLVVCAVLGWACAASAQKPPAASLSAALSPLSVAAPTNLDPRIRVFAYTPDVVYTLPVTVGMHTHIQLGSDEKLIEQPRLGETVQWRISGNAKQLYIKALAPNVRTSMTLVTDRRIYQFELASTSSPAERVQKAYFNYPDDEQFVSLEPVGNSDGSQAMLTPPKFFKSQELSDTAMEPSQMRTYKVTSTDERMRQVVAFDNGIKTSFRLPEGVAELPVVFAVGTDEKLMPVNFTVKDRASPRDADVVMVDRVSERWVLKLGALQVNLMRQ